MQVPIETAKRLAKELDVDAVIVIAFRGDRYATTSYGKDRATCRAFATVCDQIHNNIAGGEIPIPAVCDHPWHNNPGLITACPSCGVGG